MADYRALLKQPNRAFAAESGESDTILLSIIRRETSGVSDICGAADSFTTSINFGRGPNITEINIGSSSSTINFNGNLELSEFIRQEKQINLTRKNAATGAQSAFVIERGSTGDDFLLLWNEVAGRAEIGFADTSEGTVIPASLSTFGDLALGSIIITGSTVSSTATLSLDAGANDLGFTSRSATINLSDVSNTSPAGFINTSIIGIINELKTMRPFLNDNSFVNGETFVISQGELVYILADDAVALSDASSDTASANYIGVVVNSSVNAGASVNIGHEGVVDVLFEAALTPAAGDVAYLSTTVPGRATNIKPTTTGTITQPIGYIKNVDDYAGFSLVSVHMVRGKRELTT